MRPGRGRRDHDPATPRNSVAHRVVVETALAVVGSTAVCYLAYLAAGLSFPSGGAGGVVMLVAPVATPLLVAPFVALPFARASERITRLLGEVDRTRHALAREVDERAEVQRRLEELARRDPLTGLLNRRGFFELAASRDRAELALMVVDVDDFKLVNDRWGHATGDMVLCRIATALSGAAGPSAVARLGGDEFALVVDATDLECLERAAGELAALRITLPDGTETEVACSAGSSLLAAGASIDAALAAADAAMYAVKRRGALGRHGGDGWQDPARDPA